MSDYYELEVTKTMKYIDMNDYKKMLRTAEKTLPESKQEALAREWREDQDPSIGAGRTKGMISVRDSWPCLQD